MNRQRMSSVRVIFKVKPQIPRVIVSAAIFVFLLGSAVALDFTDSWNLIGIEHAGGQKYADLRYLTATADCYRTDPTWSLMSRTCDPLGRENNYPSPWVSIYALLGASYSNTVNIAIGYMFAFAVSCGLVLWTATAGESMRWTGFVPTLAVAVAPPTWLALERGSNEVVIFSVVVVALVALVHNWRWVSAVLLSLATILKFFPVGAALAFLRGWPKGKWSLIMFMVLTATGLFAIASELSIITARTPQPTESAFGAAQIFRYAQVPGARIWGFLLFLATLIALVIAVRSTKSLTLRNSVRLIRQTLHEDSVAANLLLFGGAPLLTAYILGSNYDYRLIFLIPVVAGVSRLAPSRARTLMILVAVLLPYLGFVAPNFLQTFGDLLMVPFMALLLLLVLLATDLPFPPDLRLCFMWSVCD